MNATQVPFLNQQVQIERLRMKSSTSDRIEKQITLNAKLERVWHALTDYRQFSEWFRVKLETPFVVGERSFGQIAIPGYEHVTMEVVVVAIEPMTRFAYTWHPYAVDPKRTIPRSRRRQ